MDLLTQSVFIFILILLNAFFVASEFVLISIRRTRIEEMIKFGNPVARFLKDATEHLDNFISATQLGVTLVSLLLGWIGESVISGKVADLLNFMPRGPVNVVAHSLAFLAVFLLITYLQVVLGELVPKAIALERSELVAIIIIVPLTLFARLFYPFIILLNKSANFVLSTIRMKPVAAQKLSYSEEEMKIILNEFRQNGLFPIEEAEMMENVLKLRDINIRQIMIPRMDIVAFEETTSFRTLLKQIENKGFSRYPVYKRTIDNITGFIHVKDIYKTKEESYDDKKLVRTNLIRKIICVPESRKADQVLLDMRRKHIHLAVVDDEYGGTAGIVTLEDIIESLVGEIQDEFDSPIKEIKRQVDGSFLIDGKASIEDIKKRFRIVIKGMGYTTAGGLVFGLLGHEPKTGDRVQFGNFIFEVIEAERNRIKLIKLTREVKIS